MEFFNSAVDTLQTIVVGLGGALCVWGGVNLLEGYGADNPANLQIGVKPPNEKNYTSHIAPKSRHDKQTCKGDHFADLGFRSAAAVSRI